MVEFCDNQCWLGSETLQQIFIDLTLKAEQEEYVKEGIPWENVKYLNNKPVVEFLAGVSVSPLLSFTLQKPMGLFNILDEECLFPKGTDFTFLEKLQRNFSNSPFFKGKGRDTFSVQHYAGEV